MSRAEVFGVMLGGAVVNWLIFATPPHISIIGLASAATALIIHWLARK